MSAGPMSASAPPDDALPPNVIRLSVARPAWISGRCQHARVEVDAELAECACLDCGAKLNPIAVLVRYATQESRMSRQIAEKRALDERLAGRLRCKCQHCGLFTRVRP